MLKRFLCVLVLAGLAQAQGTPSQSNYPATAASASGAPSPTTCGGKNQFYVNTANGDLYTCPAGTYVLAGGGGSGALTLTLSDNGTTLTYTGTGGINSAGGVVLSGASGAATTISTSATNASLFLAPNGTGGVVLNDATLANPAIVFAGDTTTGFSDNSTVNHTVAFSANGTSNMEFDSSGPRFSSVGQLRWSSGGVGTAADTGISRDAAAVIDMGNGTQGNKTAVTNGKRWTCDGGTTLVAGDFVLSGGWGTTASIAITNVTSKDCAAIVTVTSAGTGQAANPTIAFTFHDGTWANVPAAMMLQNGGTGIFGDMTTTAMSATAFTWQWNATPTAAQTYQFLIQVFGT